MKRLNVALASLLLFATSYLQADIIIPALITWGGINHIFSWSLIIAGFILEFIIMSLLIRKQFIKVFIVTTVMNLLSTFVGVLATVAMDIAIGHLVHFGGLSASFFYGPPDQIFNLYSVLFFISAVLANVFIETGVAKIFFRTIPLKRLILWLMLANSLSVGIGLGGLGVYMSHHEGRTPVEQEIHERFEQEWELVEVRERKGRIEEVYQSKTGKGEMIRRKARPEKE